MNDIQNAKMKVIRSVLAVLAEHSAEWQGVAKLTAMVTELTALEKSIDGFVKQQGTPLGGATELKRQARETLRDMTLAASGMLKAHAGDTDPELAARAAITSTDMLRRREVDALAAARRIEQLATEHPQAITDGAQDPQFMAKFSTAIETYANALDGRRQLVVARGVVTAELQKAIEKAGELLVRLDGAMAQFDLTNPTLATAYRLARIDTTPGPAKQQPETAMPASAVAAPAPLAQAA